ncbi:MAG: repressor LexA [Pseudomonadales bacterium]|nr:transcriptional repressor LexA [Pseudomonadales bacterium]MCP5214354.1 repressor LexA [Pseudomonadales bacterium]MCP5303355.1 repressor LexA [Pseudomonadales bacterium]
MVKLTVRQNEVLACIKKHIDHTGYPPTRAEIARDLGFRSANAAEDHLKALARKGVIEMINGASRGLRLVVDEETIPQGLPVIGRVAAGSPILAEQHIEHYANINANCFSPTANYLLKVQGDSMIDAGIFDGDLVAVKQQQDIANGQIVVARINDEVTVKRYKKEPKQILLIAENKDFQPIKVDAQSGEFAIEGLVVGVIRQRVS